MGCFRSAPVAPAPPFPDDLEEQNRPGQEWRNRRGGNPSAIHLITYSIIIFLSAGVPLLWFMYLFTVQVANIFDFAEFRVDSISFSPPNINSSEPAPAAEWNVEVSVWNPAKHHRVSFRDVEVSVWYNNATEFLSAARVENFSQGPKARTKLRAHPKARLGNSVATAIDRNVTTRDGVIDFGLRVMANGTYPLWLTTEKYHVSYDILCRDLKVVFSPTAAEWTMVGGFRECF